MHALLSPGDHVVCTFPGYQSLYELARSIGCEVDLWRPQETGGVAAAAAGASAGWLFDPADLEALLRPTTKLVVWNFPHNPTGALPSSADYTAHAESGARGRRLALLRRDVPVVGADARATPPGGGRCLRPGGLAGRDVQGVGLAGLRIGWVAAHDGALLERMKALKDYTTICSSAPSELLALMALRSPGPILDANLVRIDRNTRIAADFFAPACRHLRLAASSGRNGLLPAVARGHGRRGGGPDGAEAFCARVLEATGALVLPSTVYDYGDRHFRLGLGRADFGEGLAALEAFLSAE